MATRREGSARSVVARVSAARAPRDSLIAQGDEKSRRTRGRRRFVALARQVERERRRVEQGVEREQGQEQGVIALAADCAEGVAVGDVRQGRDAECDVQESRVALQRSTHHA